MSQRPLHPRSIDRLGLAAWLPSGRPQPEAMLGSLAETLGQFAPAPDIRIVVPAQRVAPPLEATTG
ncbi:MAG: hypothetical protein ACT4O0_21285 [Pseudonocardia sp.]